MVPYNIHKYYAALIQNLYSDWCVLLRRHLTVEGIVNPLFKNIFVSGNRNNTSNADLQTTMDRTADGELHYLKDCGLLLQ